mmetsp:Transcript_29872/g.78784  ORF Transcript_29872/g.78784 Transcript_29872/m.78784 type:complete len:227 (-) Transcript_29872:21-701(-)
MLCNATPTCCEDRSSRRRASVPRSSASAGVWRRPPPPPPPPPTRRSRASLHHSPAMASATAAAARSRRPACCAVRRGTVEPAAALEGACRPRTRRTRQCSPSPRSARAAAARATSQGRCTRAPPPRCPIIPHLRHVNPLRPQRLGLPQWAAGRKRDARAFPSWPTSRFAVCRRCFSFHSRSIGVVSMLPVDLTSHDGTRHFFNPRGFPPQPPISPDRSQNCDLGNE